MQSNWTAVLVSLTDLIFQYWSAMLAEGDRGCRRRLIFHQAKHVSHYHGPQMLQMRTRMLHRPEEDSWPSPVWSWDHSRSISNRKNRDSILGCMQLGVVKRMGGWLIFEHPCTSCQIASLSHRSRSTLHFGASSPHPTEAFVRRRGLVRSQHFVGRLRGEASLAAVNNHSQYWASKEIASIFMYIKI